MSDEVLGVLGGAFDPPHIGHVMVPTYVISRGLADKVIVAPCWIHPLGKSMTPFSRRLGWTHSAMAVHGAQVVVSDIERRVAGDGPSYTIDLLEALAREYPDTRVRLIMGSDIIDRGETSRWHRYDELARRFDPIVVPRAGFAPAEDCALPDVSSTQVRQWLATPERAESKRGLERALPASVHAHLTAQAGGSVWLVGHGHVATHVEPWLAARGFRTVFVGARALVESGAVPPKTSPRGVWILVPDGKIEAVASALANTEVAREGVPVLHGAGARLARPTLFALAEAGCPVGTLHPICSLRSEQAQSRLTQATFGIEGDDDARSLARELVGEQAWLDLQALDAEQRVAYHGACALVANHLAVLEDEAAEVLTRLGYGRADAERAFGVLLRSSLDNLLQLGIPDGITGPISRGDRATADAHADALGGPTGELYRTLSERLAKIVGAS